MNIDAYLLQQTRLFQRLATTENGMPDNWVVVFVESRPERLEHGLLFKKTKSAEPLVNKKYIVRNAQLRPQGSESGFFFAGSERVAQPLPGFALVLGDEVALYNRQGLAKIYPVTKKLSPQDKIRSCVEYAH